MEFKNIISSGLLELYITGIASPEENAEIENLIKKYPEVKLEVEELQTAMESYAMAHAIQPDPSVREKILSQIPNTVSREELSSDDLYEKNSAGKIYKMLSNYKWAAAASFLLLLGSLILSYTYYNKYHSSSVELAAAQQKLSEFANVQQQLEQQKQIAAAMNKDMEVVSNKYAKPVALNGTPHSPDAEAKIFWMKNTGEVYVDPTNLPQVPSDKQYQLWAIVDGKPVDAGIISSKNGMYHMQKMKTFGKAQAFAITLEKTGGSKTPDMDQMYVMAKI